MVSDAHANTRLIGVALMVWAVPRLARYAGTDPDHALWLAVCCPLTTLSVVGGMHNDGLQVGLSLVALVVAIRLALIGRGWLGLVLGGAFVGLAGGVKQPGVLAGVGIVAWFTSMRCVMAAVGGRRAIAGRRYSRVSQ